MDWTVSLKVIEIQDPFLQDLFSIDPKRWDTVKGYFTSMSRPPITDDDFGVMCNDLMVELQNEKYYGDPVWKDIEHGWY